ncbi:MAG: PadR family transcriptional regulator [Candidatus Nanoarchaeia archaeon]
MIVLKALNHNDMSGYKLMQFLEGNTGKKPSAGSMYPLLEDLHREGLVDVRQQKRSKIYSLTKKGKVEARASMKKIQDIHKKLGSTMKMFCHLIDEKQMSMITDAVELLQKDPKKIHTFTDEVLPVKMELMRILKEDKKENIIKAKKIVGDAANKLKKLR